MKSQSTYKVPQGKLLKISLEYDEKKNIIDDWGIKTRREWRADNYLLRFAVGEVYCQLYKNK